MRVLVTGGGGFLGSHLVAALRARGYDVITFSRSPHAQLIALGARCYYGDLADYYGLQKLLSSEKIDAIFHVAAQAAMWGRYRDFHRTNVVGTQNLVKLAQKFAISKFIYTSSPSTIFAKEPLCGVNEETPYPPRSCSAYARTKRLAEESVLKSSRKDFWTISLRPHLIWGAGDPHLIPRLVARARKGRLRQIGNGSNRVSICHISNAVNAHLAAFDTLMDPSRQRAAAGKAYFIADPEVVNLWAFVDRVLQQHALPTLVGRAHIPLSVAYTLGALLEGLYGLFRIYRFEPPMTRFIALQLAKDHYFSCARAEQLLSFQARPMLEEGLAQLRPQS